MISSPLALIPKALCSVPLVSGTFLLLMAGISLPVMAQESCTPRVTDQQLQVQLESVTGDPIDLGHFPDGLQAVILTNRSTSSQSREVATRLRLEFDRYDPFRRVIVIDGTKVAAVEGLVLDSLRESATQPDAPVLTVDFQGEQIAPLRQLVTQAFSDWDESEQGILFILDGSGQVLSLHVLDQSLEPARQCLRDLVRQLDLQISSVDL